MDDNSITFNEGRLQPRFRTDFKATLTTSSGEQIGVVITNISLSGLQLKGDDALPFKLFADRHQQRTPKLANFTIKFAVPTTTRDQAVIDIQCQPVYIRRVSKECSLVGSQFCHFNRQTEADLADYINHFGVPL